MKRKAFLTSAALSTGALAVRGRARAAEDADVSLNTATGTIYGSLMTAATRATPVVLIIAGSGPTDRNGNSSLGIRPNTYALLAEALRRRGVASVRYDKRGIAASSAAATSESALRFDDYVDDAAAWLRLLRKDRRFSALIVAGHSEGSLIGMIAANRAPAEAFVSLEGAGRPAPAVLREQLKPKLTPALYAQSDDIIARLERGQSVPDAPQELAALFRPSVQPYLISWFKYDPAAEIARLRIPVTIVQGTADVQVGVDDAQALKRAAPSAKLAIVPGMNHVLKHAPDVSSQPAILRGYQDSSLAVEPQAVAAVYSALTAR
ncbi:MAG: alpha/beta fold hydrolase [Candidatus Eremiobacteraeota bacterium]|nr:alpha/beta fold hydrolase [Candidatus Eremiobacteraeota bacterium]